MYRYAGWSDKEVSAKSKLAIRQYMEKSIKAGSRDPGHLFELHVQDLYKKDMFFSDSNLLEEPREMAKKACSLDNPPPTPQSSFSSPELPSLFSKEFLFHASLCCKVVNEYTPNNFFNFFLKSPKACHDFDEMSMTTPDGLRRCLIAKQRDLIFYIAFNGELDKAMWPTECSDMDIIDGKVFNTARIQIAYVK